jgi:hypothetical protein
MQGLLIVLVSSSRPGDMARVLWFLGVLFLECGGHYYGPVDCVMKTDSVPCAIDFADFLCL